MEFTVEASMRLDKFLAAHVVGFSRVKLQRLIRAGAVKVNGRAVIKSSSALRPGDRIAVSVEAVSSPVNKYEIVPEPNISLEIVYEDRDIAVVNKPAGLLTHPTASQPAHTLVNALVARYPTMTSVGENPLRPGIVHRLDKDTSGLLVAAKNQKAFMFLKRQFLERKVVKKYLALVEGVPRKKEGVIEYAIRPSKQMRLKKVAVKLGRSDLHILKKSIRAATTFYSVQKVVGEKFALVECEPKTGRTHQIRVHLAAIGHPIVGDKLYGKRQIANSRLQIGRQFLHAYYLKFTAPSGTPLALEIELPRDLKDALTKLSGKD